MSLGRLTPIVIDASALLEYVARTEVGRQVASILEEPDAPLHVPTLCDVEFCAGLREMLREEVLVGSRAASALAIYANLPLARHGHQRLMPRIIELRDNFSASGATYVALCERLNATLVTCDRRVTKAAGEHLSLNVIGVTG